MSSEAGRRYAIGAFTIVRELGRGGMGVVYEAVERETGRTVALKVVRGGRFVDASVVRLFRREIKALARLEHPGIATLYASGRTEDGLHYFAMELVDGVPLDAWIAARRQALTREDLDARLGLFLAFADAVAYAHERGVIHRDIKPSNLFVTADGPQVRVLDFGLARITDADVSRATKATELGMVRGTLAYMSPEQLSGRADLVDARTDVYALGIVLCEMIAGEHPLDLQDVPTFDLARVLRDDPPRSLRSLWKGSWRLDPDLSTIVAKALEKDPARRFGSVGAFADDLRRFRAGQPIRARSASAAYQLRKLVLRHKLPFTALTIVLGLLVAFSAAMTIVAGNLAEERNRANREAERANQEARAAQQGARVLSELLRVDLGTGFYADRTLDPKEVERVVAALEARWPDRPEATVRMLEDAGVALAQANVLEPAIRLLERAVALRRDVLRDPDWEIHSRRISLGEYAATAGRLREAEQIFASALERLRAGPNAAPINLGYVLEDLGCARRDLGKLDEAESLLREALSHYRSSQPSWLPYLASGHDSLGTLYLARGDLARAEAEHREALRLRDLYSTSDMNRVRSSYMLGLVLVRRGRTAEAAPMLQEALDRRTRLYGPLASDVAAVQDALAELHLADGELDRAEDALRHALAALDASLPPQNPARATALEHLAELRRRQGRGPDARAALSEALEIRAAVLGEDHPDSVRARAALEAL